MQNFQYYTPTKVYFGRGSQTEVGRVLKEYGCTKVLLHYGGGSVLKSGLLDEIKEELKAVGISYIELGGVAPNPKIDLIREGIALCKKETVDFILALGGGSVIDSAKSISMGLANNADPWDMILTQTMPVKAFPMGVVLTIAAAGSEMSNSHVITNPKTHLKRSLNHDLLRPVFAFMNPEHTFTVSAYQTACGIVDIMMHTLERYFTADRDNELTDSIAQAILSTTIKAGLTAMANPTDYEARAALMWASSLSHNGLTGCGKTAYFPAHKIEHDISGLVDCVSHGAGLAVVFPAWAKYVYRYDVPKFAQLANRVWGIEIDREHPENSAYAGINSMIDFFKKLKMPTTMKELHITPNQYETIANLTTDNGTKYISSYLPLGKKELMELYKLAE